MALDMSTWIDIGPESDFTETERQTLTVDGRAVLILNIGDKMIATTNCCPHAGKPMADGEIRNGAITCPSHGYTYDITTGKNIDHPHTEQPLRIYPLRKADNGNIEIQLPEKPF